MTAPPMKQCRLLMGMPITVEILDDEVTVETFDEVFSFFQHVDQTFSTYRDSSEISRINRGELAVRDSSMEVRSILALSEQSRHETRGFFDVQRNGQIDPSGVVKGWAVQQAANQLRQAGCSNFYVDAGGDIQVAGLKNGVRGELGSGIRSIATRS